MVVSSLQDFLRSFHLALRIVTCDSVLLELPQYLRFDVTEHLWITTGSRGAIRRYSLAEQRSP
jgi:hypothetical protein